MKIFGLKKKWISMILILSMILTMLPSSNFATVAKAESTGFGGPIIHADGTVTFRYHGDVDTEAGQFVVIRGAFNNWTNVKMDQAEDGSWSKTLEVAKSGIYEYGMAVVTELSSQEGWVGDPSNQTVGGNAAIVRNTQVNSVDGTAKIYYYPTDYNDVATVYYRLSGSTDSYKTIDMAKDSKYTAIYSASIVDDAGDYEYYIDVNGESIVDPNTESATFTIPTIDKSLVADTFENQPGGNSVWRITGSLGDLDSWNISNDKTIMSHIVGEYYAFSTVLPAGNYEFKFTKNGSWDNAIGNKNGDNFSLTLDKATKVNFYVNDELDSYDKIRTNLDCLVEQGIEQYIPAKSLSEWPRLVGNIQEAVGDGTGVSWSPADAKAMFVDYYFNDTVYKLQKNIAKGNYECKVVFGDSWDGMNYGVGNDNLAINILDSSAAVTFTTDTTLTDKVLQHNYKPQDSIYDGLINSSQIYFDSRDITYKKPFGAIKQGQQDVTFRIATEANDASLVKLELIDGKELSKTYNMSVTTVLDGKDYWEVVVPASEFDEIGVWGYKFIVIDGSTKVEYGDDAASGGTGAYSNEGQTPYNLTVYAADYKTPDWMKDAIVYQIFPDRFFDGDTTNNRAKTVDGHRGYLKDGLISFYPLQYFDGLEGSEGVWSDYPENPRHIEEANKPYYPDAKSDGVWSNEFYGGDIAGISEKLSYLQSLGVTAIYLNPVSWAASNHKYDATDYKHLDPMFGEVVYNVPGDPTSGMDYEATREASDKVYQAFADTCNKLGIHLIVDGVFNHVGDDSIYFDRYEKYPEIGAYEYWSRVWDEVEKTIPLSYKEAKSKYEIEAAYDIALKSAKDAAIITVKNYYKSIINKATGKNYTEDDFNYTTWFTVGPDKVYDEKTGEFVRYDYEGWWGFDSLPVVDAVESDTTSLTNDEHATITGLHEYNNVDFREKVIGYDLAGKSDADASKSMQDANSQRWLWMGSSGWRLDVAPDVSNETWQQFRISVKSAEGRTDANGNAIPDPIILGEEWNVATKYLLGDMFDSVMNYQFRAALQNFIINDNDAANFNTALEVIRENYPEEAWLAMLNLVDSHDTVRNITKIDYPTWEEENIKIAPEASEKAMKLQALTAIFQMSYPGAPTIYYGDEVGVTGTKDPDSRRSFPWDRLTENSDGTYTADSKYAELYNTYVKASEVRTNYRDVFATGDIKTAYAEGSVIAYARKSDKLGGLSILNKSKDEITIEADVMDFLPDGLTLKDQLGTNLSATVTDGKVTIKVPGFTGMMMVSTSELTALPVAPSNLTAVASEGKSASVSLTWDAVEGATGYFVYRTLLEGTSAVRLTNEAVTDTTFVDTTVENGTRYYYYVKTVVDKATSVYSDSATALPSYKIQSISKPSALPSMNIGVGNKTGDTEVDIFIPGLTDNGTYSGKEVPGLTFTLVYYTGDGTDAKETKLRYKEDASSLEGGALDSKRYSASFEPTDAGTYSYYAKATVNNGYTYVSSDIATMEALASATDTTPPTEPVLAQSIQESNRVTLNWTVEDTDIAGFEIYRQEVNGSTSGKIKIDTVDKATLSYVDFTVSNDTEYIYQIAAFDDSYNRSYSDMMRITPKLTMVDVTIRLHIPDKVFTSATDNIYIAGDVNGWNQAGWLMKKPSGATNNNIVEYSFKMMSGKSIQYKYTRGTWATEALTSTSANDVTSPGNYGYSSMDTNIHVTIKNQGANKMLIEDHVLRWVDMPMMITVPRISYNGETIEYTTTESTFNLQASVPFGGIFTINDEDINSIQQGALDRFGNVRLDNIPLNMGLNTFVLHIEPTAETKSQPWLTDTGRITSQMTATTTIKITRTNTETPTTPTPTTPSPTTPTTPTPTTPTVPPTPTPTPTVPTTPTPMPITEPQIEGKNGGTGWIAINKIVKEKVNELEKQKDDEKVVAPAKITITMNDNTELPTSTLKLIKGKNIILVLDMGEYSWTINGKSIQTIKNSVKEYDLGVAIPSKESKAINNAINTLIKNKKVKKVTQVKQLKLSHDGTYPFNASLQINIGKKYKDKYIFLNYYNGKTKKLEVKSYHKVDKNGNIKLNFKNGSDYVMTLENIQLPTVAKTKTLAPNKSTTIKVTNSLSSDKITYQSSNKLVATISKSGKITAKKSGVATITTKVVQGNKTYTFKTKVTIKK